MYKNLLFLLFFLLPACSTYLNRDEDAKGTKITSNPTSAYIYVNGTIAKTPTNIKMQAVPKEGYIIKFRKEGYKEKIVVVDKKFRATSTILGNMFWVFCYPLAVWVDLQNSAWDFADEVHVILAKEND